MLNMNVRIYQKNGTWFLEVNCPSPQGTAPYHFQKDFQTAEAAKLFFYQNIGLFIVHMGNV